MTDRALPDFIDSYMEFTENSEPADSFRLWTAVSAIAACLRRKTWLEWGSLIFYPNMYVVLVGPSGCRKGTAMGPAFSMLLELNIRMAAEATTREALIRELRTSSDTTLNLETGTQIMHSSLTIYAQELTVFLGYNNMQLLSDLTDWYDCRQKWTYRTKNMGTDDITGVWVNLIGATTPSLLQTTLPSDAIGGGLTSRMIFVYEARKGKQVVVPFLSESQAALRPQLLHDLEAISLLAGQFRYSIDFIESYTEWYLNSDLNPPFSDDRLAGYLERRANHILKLSMIMAASRSSQLFVNSLDFRRAQVLLEATEKKMLSAFAGVGRAATASVQARLMAIMEEKGALTQAEIYRRFSHDADSRAIDNVLTSLCNMGFMRVNRIGPHMGYKLERSFNDEP